MVLPTDDLTGTVNRERRAKRRGWIQLLLKVRAVLGESQVGLGVRAGASRRTGQRWFAGEATPKKEHLLRLAREVLARDPQLAALLASKAGSSLQALAPEPAKPPAPPPPPIATDHLVDSVVCAAVDASGASTNAVRAALLAAIERARHLRLGFGAIETALRAKVPSQ